MTTTGNSLKQCASFTNRTSRVPTCVGMRTRLCIGRHALLVDRESRPVDITRMMVLDQHLPFVPWQFAHPLAPRAGFVEHCLMTILAINIRTRIDRIGENGVNSMIACLAPAQILMFAEA